MKIGFLFAAQGAQYLGMGRDLFEQEAIVRKTFRQACDVLGFDLTELIFAKEEKLNQTRYTQPAILTVSVAFWRLLEERGIKADAVAGLSLGEYSAMVASGALDFRDAVKLVAKRGKFMTEATPAGTTKMVAVLNAKRGLVEEICQRASEFGVVSPANYNTPSQIVIGGEVAAVDKAVLMLKEAGVKRLVELKVSGAFHTALLACASEKLARALLEVDFQEFKIPLVSNVTAQVMQFAEIKDLLVRQIKSPVYFDESIVKMKKMGVDTFIEIGPGKVLSGFVRKIDQDLRVTNLENEKTYQQTLAILGEK